jgi:formylglycine-generating enzyme required for sulfatase activity
MPADRPIVFLAFADARSDLSSLKVEGWSLRDQFDELKQRGVIADVVVEEKANLERIYSVFLKHRDRIALFHFGGHADGDRLLLESAFEPRPAYAEGLATLLGHQRGLKLVFLNGCSTRPQVKRLLNAGVPAVIATARPLDDRVAADFAVAFYQALTTGYSGENRQITGGCSLARAFALAESLIKAARGGKPRDLFAKNPTDEDVIDDYGFPWEFRPGTEHAERWSLFEDDPLFGLPKLPIKIGWPVEPYRNLEYFGREHARIFFGRGRAIRELYDLLTLTAERAESRLIFYYGQTGVGKTSVLAAGLLPRVETMFETRYCRRSAQGELLGTLRTTLAPGVEPFDLGSTWLGIERKAQRPLLIVLDQAEEVFTRHRADARPQAEVRALFEAIREAFAPTRTEQPQGRLILSFRKEWLAEFDAIRKALNLDTKLVMLNPLDRRGVIEAIEGPADHFSLVINPDRNRVEQGEPTLAEFMSIDLFDTLAKPQTEQESPIAPTLQILLSRMWKEANDPKRLRGRPTFDRALYQDLKGKGFKLDEVIQEQFDKIAKDEALREAVENGLLLDLLEFFTTREGTADTHTREEIHARYPHRTAKQLDDLLQACQNGYLLAYVVGTGDTAAYRLTHDTLAPLLRERFRVSADLAQRARHVLEGRAAEWKGKEAGPVLDRTDLLNVEHGIPWMRAIQDNEPRLLEASLVEVIRVAETKDVLPLAKQLVGRGLSAREKEIFSRMKSDGDSKDRLHASLVLLRGDDGQVEYLYHRLLEAGPTELPVIREALEPHRERLFERLRSVLEQPKDEGQCLQAASALALYDQSNPWWKNVGGKVAQAMVKVNVVYLRDWLDALRPARGELTAPLATIFRDKKHSETERSLAMNILADYASNQPTLLTDLLMDAEEKPFAGLFDKLKTYQDLAVRLLEDELAKPSPEATEIDDQDVERKKDVLAERQARAAVALIRFDKAEEVWPLMRHSADPRLRSFLVNWLRPLGADPRALATELNRLDPKSQPMAAQGQQMMDVILFHPQTSMRRALILALGQYGQEGLPPDEREALIDRFLDLYKTDPDAGIHGATEWTLRQWGLQESLKELDAELMNVKDWGDRRWFVNGQGQTLAIIKGPIEFDMGSPPTEPGRFENEFLHKQVIPRHFAIATKEVTVEQYRRFQQASPDNNDAPEGDLKRYSPDLSGPMIGVTWYRAAAYCNWLSEQERIPKEEWCYVPNKKGHYAEGMTIPEDVLERKGYRLPSEAEWEYACRAGAETSRYYGSTTDLLGRYVWYIATSQERAWPCGSLLPNDLGLFDVLGNVYEWCNGRYEEYPAGEGRRSDENIKKYEHVKDAYARLLRSGAFDGRPAYVRSASRSRGQPSSGDILFGFRPARSYL